MLDKKTESMSEYTSPFEATLDGEGSYENICFNYNGLTYLMYDLEAVEISDFAPLMGGSFSVVLAYWM